MANLTLHLLRAAHRTGAWVFDRAGPLAPALARLGYPIHDRLFPHALLARALNPAPFEGFVVYHEGRPSYCTQMLIMGMHDRDVGRLLRRVVRPGMTVVDVGAHIGYFSLVSASLVGPDGTVWAFEPSPRIIEILRKNVEENGFVRRVQVVDQAVGSVCGRADFYANPTESMLSSFHCDVAAYEYADPGAAPTERPDRIEVSCTTLDAWAARHRWPPVHLVKIDVEGAEHLVLAGMAELSRRNPDMGVIVELNIRALSTAGVTIQDFWGALRACGLSRVWVPGRSLRPVEFPLDWLEIAQEIRRRGNGCVNLFCRRGPV